MFVREYRTAPSFEPVTGGVDEGIHAALLDLGGPIYSGTGL